MTPQLPPDHIVRYDYHTHPRSTTAVITNQRTRNVVAVGVAKFNPRDGEPNRRAGEQIALHRALASMRPSTRARMRERLPRVAVAAPQAPTITSFPPNLKTPFARAEAGGGARLVLVPTD